MTAATKIGRMGRAEKEPDTNTYQGRVAERLRELRKDAGYDDVGAFVARLHSLDLPVGESTYRAWENGGREVPLKHVPVLAKALRVTVREFWPAK